MDVLPMQAEALTALGDRWSREVGMLTSSGSVTLVCNAVELLPVGRGHWPDQK